MRHNRSVCVILCCLLNLAGLPAASAYESSYMPFSSKQLSRRVRQKLIADPLEAGKTLNIGKTKIEIPLGGSPFVPESTTLQVHGSDNAGKPWSYVSSAWTGSASIWSADLDKNGMDDLIILMHTGGCGMAPTCDLLVLMFERNGRPMPWVTDGYFEVDSHGIKDFVDLENDGHCQLIRQSFDDGYWMTSVYQATSSRWHRLSNISGMSLPLYTRFSNRENHQAIKPPAFRHPFEADLSNDFANPLKSPAPLFLDAFDWPKVQNSEDPCLLFSDGKRARPKAWYATMTVIIEEPSGRKMASLSTPEAVHRILNEMRCRRLPISFAGARTRSGLSSEYLFAYGICSTAKVQQHQSAKSKSIDLALSIDRELP